MSETCHAELGPQGLPIRIFNSCQAANEARNAGKKVVIGVYSSFIDFIRRAVFERDDFQCTHCGAFVTWKTGQMDERLSRGDGGEVSVENGQTLCAKCHIVGPDSKHGKERLPRFSKGPNEQV